MKTLIYIISSPRSGSTLLANILGNSDNVFNVGELTSVNGFIKNNSRQAKTFQGLCSCGTLFKECSFWNPILNSSALALNISQEEIDTKVSISTSYRLRYFFLRRYLKKITAEILKDKKGEICAKNTFGVLDQIVKATGSTVIVDSSKNLLSLISYAHYLPNDWNLKIIHIYRRPGATAYSVRKAGERLKMEKYYSYFLNLIKCIHFNNLLRRYLTSVSHLSISHEDLCLKYAETEKALLDYLDIDSIKYLNLESDKRTRHDIGGSVSINRLHQEIKLKLDSDWLEKLTRIEKIGTLLLTMLLCRY